MKKWLAQFLRIAAFVWVPVTSSLAIGYASTIDQTPEAPGVHLSVGTLVVLVGIIVVIGPAFYWAGRFHGRLTSVEQHISRIVDSEIETGKRVATSLERVADSLESNLRTERSPL
jgi:hypothetical protein